MYRHQFMAYDDYGFDPPEINSGEIIVETAGYIDPKTQIEAMIQAGIRLELSRPGMYDSDYEDYDEDTFMDPTRRPGFDMADASILAEAMLAKARSKQDLKPTEDPISKQDLKPTEDPRSTEDPQKVSL